MDVRWIPDSTYQAMIVAILALEPFASTEKVTFDQIAVALGDVGNIWPEGLKNA